MRIAISILNFYREDLTYSIISQLREELEFEEGYDVDMIIGVNKLSDGISFDRFSERLNKLIGSVNVGLSIKNNGFNLGFGQGHNLNLLGGSHDLFLILNNDLIFKEKGWLSKLINNCIDAVGLSNAPHHLLIDGSGDPDVYNHNYDYIEASCLMIKGNCFNKIKGFDDSFLNAYFEDSDLSLRLKFNGFQLNWIEIDHEHLRSSSAKKIDPFVLKRMININQRFFQKRWGWYLSNKRHAGIILIINSAGLGDVVNTFHAIANLKHVYGDSLYVMENPFSWYFVELGVKVLRRKEDSKLIGQLYAIDIFKNIEFRSQISVERQVYNYLGSTFNLSENIKRACSLSNNKVNERVIIHIDYNREATWQGRSADIMLFSNISEFFIQKGYEVIIISEKKPRDELMKSFPEAVNFKYELKMRETFHLVSSCEYFAGIDSLIFNIAQFFYKKTILMMGPTSVTSRINRGIDYVVFQNEQLRCLGCYNDMSADKMNKCLFVTPLCVTVNLTKEEIYMRLDKFVYSNYFATTELQPSFMMENEFLIQNFSYSGTEALSVLVRVLKNRLILMLKYIRLYGVIKKIMLVLKLKIKG